MTMLYQILVLRDIKANEHYPPMFVKNLGVAFRDLGDILRDPQMKQQAPWAKHPEDVEMWHVGAWDSERNHFDTPHDGSTTDPQSLGLLSKLAE